MSTRRAASTARSTLLLLDNDRECMQQGFAHLGMSIYHPRVHPRRAHRTADAAAACASTMKDNVVSRNWKGWVATAFKTALFCQFVRVFSYQKQTSSRILVAIVAMWIGWVAFGLLLVRRTLALCDELPP